MMPDELTVQCFTVLVFGQVAQAAGGSRVRVNVAGGEPTCADLRVAIEQQHPGFAAMVRSCRIAVNHEFAAETRVVQGGDEIALIGFVSGG